MAYRDAAFHIRDLAARQAVRLSAESKVELLSLQVAAAFAYGRLIGDATDVRNSAVLQERLDRIALALSAVATLYTGDTDEGPLVRKDELAKAINTLCRAGVSFTE